MEWYWWVLILALPAGFLRLVAHELSHAAAALATGGSVDWSKFRPWPHKLDGRWMWGSMVREGGNDLIISIAPLARATAFMVAWLIPALIWWYPLLTFAFWELTDVLHWWRGWFWQPYTDGGRTREILRQRNEQKQETP